MKQINLISKGRTLLFMLCALFAGTSPAWAEAGDYTVDFNGLTELPEGWEAVETTIGFSYGAATYEIGTDYSLTGKGLYTYQTSYAGYIVTAPVTGDISFWVRARAKKKACGVKVFKYDGTNFTEIAAGAKSYTSSNSSIAWSQVCFSLTEGTRIAFQLNNAAIDDFVAEKYEETGAIDKPTAFEVSSKTYNSATFSWTAGGKETAWQLVYSTEADFEKMQLRQ